MHDFIIAFTISNEDNSDSVKVYLAGLSEGLDMTAKCEVALHLDSDEAEDVAKWLKEQNLPGMSNIEIEQHNNSNTSKSI